MKTQFKLLLLLPVAVAASLAFTVLKTKASAPKRVGWVTIFDGKTLNGWHGYNKTGAVTSWEVENGALVCLGTAKDASGGDIVSDKQYANFELKWEWKVDKGSNSGVMYHVQEGSKYHSPYETGPEYQIIDDVTFPEHLENWQKTGADYAMHTPNDQKALNPVGQWNVSRIVFYNGHVEHWLNGKKIVEFEAWSDDWNKKRETGKWKDYPDYGKAKTGEIALQDHGDKAYYKNIEIREL
jgi:3-keto-disaccharide hydrolase